MGGLALPQILRAEAESGRRSSHKSIIMIFLSGGPPHPDMVDLKPDAPAEIRGEFKPIATRVPGIQVCEHLPRIAAMTVSPNKPQGRFHPLQRPDVAFAGRLSGNAQYE